MPDPYPSIVALGLVVGLACAILIGRWGWREAKEYLRSRDAIRRISSRIPIDKQ